MFSSEKGTWTLWLVHYVYEAIPINFYIHYTPLCCCVFARLCLFLLSPHSFSFIFSSFYLNHQLFLAQSIMDIICASMIWTAWSKGMKKRKTFNRPSSRLLVDILLLFIIVCAVLSCCYVLLIHFALKLLISPSKARVSLCRFIDLASVLQQQQLPQPRDIPAAVRGQGKEREEKSFSFMCIEEVFFIQIM